ncbi:MAG: sodium:calcium antiporter [Alphaproteobacteria bacterium BRH_c36]|nr:MAG: sodium:calcium antiporter [Alphaproteobacteria bacterium BRH_c36]
MLDIIFLLVGFALLIAGGELLVRGSVAVAQRIGVSPLIIGIVLVGFGTSMPELVISVQASLAGSPGISIGNFVGSNIANILLIVGVAALIAPLTVTSRALKRDGGVVVAASAAFLIIAFVSPLNQPIGALFVAMLAAYLVFAIRQERLAPEEGHSAAFEMSQAEEEFLRNGDHWAARRLKWSNRLGRTLPYLMALAGLATIIFGGRLLVDSAVSLAREIGVTEAVIGLTIIAVGTSLPELVTSVVAARRGHSDVAVGNVMGSCIYNVLGIGGVVGLLAPTNVPEEIIRYDNFVMVGAAVALVVVAANGGRISRLEGTVMLAAYVLYIYSLWPH